MSDSSRLDLLTSSDDHRRMVAMGALIMVTIVSMIGLYWPTIRVLVPVWMNRNSDFYGTVWLILPVSLYLMWQQRDAVVAPPRYRWAGLCLVGLLSIGWWIAGLVSIATMQLLIVTVLLPTGVWAVSGYETFKRWLFPLGLLLFLVPLADFFVPALQDLTAWSAVTLLQMTQIPVHLDGRIIMTPRRQWIVLEACSGVRWVIATAMFSYLYAGLYLRTWSRRVAFMSIAVLLPIVTNMIRAYVVPLLDYWNISWTQDLNEFLAGWLFFGLIIVALLWIGARWQAHEADGKEPMTELHEAPSVGAIRHEMWIVRTAIVAITLTLSAIGPLMTLAMNAGSQTEIARLPPERIPRMVAEPPWSESNEEQVPWRPAFKGQSGELYQTFSWQGQQVTLYIAYYPVQREQGEAVSEGNRLYDYDKSWEVFGEGTTKITVDGHPLLARRHDLREFRKDQGAKRVVLSWYWIGHTYTASMLQAKMLQLIAWLQRQPPEAAGIIVSASFSDNPTEAIEAIQAFLKHHPLEPLLVRFSTISPHGEGS